MPKASTSGSTARKSRSDARAQGRPGRKAFVSGKKKKQNTIKTTTFSDHQGRALFCRAASTPAASQALSR
ncbi:hypothetical protein SHIRM173S_04071 [Streptomyces hirsutus]